MKNKKVLIAIIVVLIILLIASGVLIYIYYGTDLLKSEKELFQKYVLQLEDEENGFCPANLVAYAHKKENSAYGSSGSFKANTEILDGTTTNVNAQTIVPMINYGNNTNINFEGKVDNPNQRIEQNITINYSDTVNMPFKFKKDGDKYTLQSDIIAPNYIGIENNNLQEFIQKFGGNVAEFPDKIQVTEIQSLKFSEEEIQHLLNNYISPMFNNLPEEKFTKTENGDGSQTYTLSITNIEIKNILVQMLQTLSNDNTMMNKTNSIIQELSKDNSSSITTEDIQELINNLNSNQMDETPVQISISQKDGITYKIDINSNEIQYNVTKDQTESDIVYNFNCILNNSSSMNLELSYVGINTNNVAEKTIIDINVPNQLNMSYTLENNVAFGNQISIGPLGTDTVILNNYPAEEVQSFLTQVVGLIVQANNTQMEQIGFPVELGNPMLMWFMGPSLLV